MDPAPLPPSQYNPILDLILQKYIQASRDTIRGPVAIKADLNVFSKANIDKGIKRPEIPEESKLRPSNFDGYNLHCFSVGGERRLAFPEIVRTILKDINVRDIFKKRENLLIFTSKCTQKQLDELKYIGVLPWTSASSDLITKSDAYRLCGALQGQSAPKCETKLSPASFEVYHECFGGCIGIFDPELYIDANATCIKCSECKCLFSPSKFVSHNHTSYDEVHTCHWGFDSSKWRIYLMLVEQKACPELLNLWRNIKYRFNSSQTLGTNTLELNQDADFVAFINSPDHKKAMVSPIETLRNQEESKYVESSSKKETVSAFRPWSPNHVSSSSYSKKYGTNSSRKEQYRYPERYSTPRYPINDKYQIPKCGCNPSSSLYMNCIQCTNAAQTCSSNLHILAQKASERPCETGIKEKYASNISSSACTCDQCRPSKSDDIESSVEDIIKNFTSKDLKLTTSTKDLARLLSSAIKQLHISHEERVREMSVNNQRLQTELHLVKLENQKRLSEARENKINAEQELETLHRERQKELSALHHQSKWDMGSKSTATEFFQVERLQKEVCQLKAHLEQSAIDRDNLEKQLTWQHKYKTSSTTDSWTPYPTVAGKFSNNDENCNKDNKTTSSHHVSVVSKSDTHNLKRDDSCEVLSPASKAIKLDPNTDSKEESSSDIEVED